MSDAPSSALLSLAIHVGLALLLLMPLVVTRSTIVPFVVGKALFARGVIEVLVVLWLALLLTDRSYRIPRSWVAGAFLAYVGVAFLSSFLGVSFTHSLWSDYYRMTGLFDLAHWFLVVVIAASTLRSTAAWRGLLNVSLGVTLVLCLLAISQELRFPMLPFLTYECRVDATLGNPAYLAAILAVAVLLAAGFLAASFLPAEPAATRRERRGRALDDAQMLRWRRVFWASVVVLGLWVLLQTGTRGAFVGLLAGAVAMPIAAVIFADRRALRPVAMAAGVVLVVTAALFGFDQAVGIPAPRGCETASTPSRLISTTTDEANVGTRIALYGISWRAFLDRPVLGWGQDSYARIFDRFVRAPDQAYGSQSFDQAHNEVMEELSTKGAVGAIAYAALWGSVVWAVVRRRRPPRDEVIAYAVLGGLAAYFVQNLVLFDTPATTLQWVLLVAWAAGQETLARVAAPVTQPPALRRRRDSGGTRASRVPSALRGIAAQRTAIGLVALALVATLYSLNYRPFDAARTFAVAFDAPISLDQRLDLARQSFDAFPALASSNRQQMFLVVNDTWGDMSPEEREIALEFINAEADRSVESDPENARLLAAVLLTVQQATGPSPELAELEPFLDTLRELAPERTFTHQLLARQALFEGDYREALRIIESFEERAPATDVDFAGIERAAREALAGGG